jgi:hypothetical protein
MIHYDVSNTVKIIGLCGAKPNGTDEFQFLDTTSPTYQPEVDCPHCQDRFAQLRRDNALPASRTLNIEPDGNILWA